MIFGFNTDVSHEGTVYHVQSEARDRGRVLQTQVFVSGRCMGKRTYPVGGEHCSESEIHALLKAQHKLAVESIREGHVRDFLRIDDEAESLSLEWTNAESVYTGCTVLMRFRVTDGGQPVAGARLVARMHMIGEVQVYAEAVSGEDGEAEVEVMIDEGDLDENSVLVQAFHDDKSVTRKFRLQTPE
jgi:hypothetical protein